MKLKVLIIDDSRVVREATRLLLESAGFSARTHDGGEDVLDAVLEDEPDLVLVDLALGERSGAQVAHDIRTLLGRGAPPVALYSAEDPVVLQRLCAGAGAAGVLQKTADHDRFLAELTRLARRVVVDADERLPAAS